MNELALVKDEAAETQIAVLKPYAAQLAEIKKANATFVFDYSDPKQNADARSHIHKLRTTKAAIEKAAKAEREDSVAYQKKVIAHEKSLVAEVVEMIELHDKPLQEWEAKEQKRKDDIKARIASMTVTAEYVIGKDSITLTERFVEISAINTDEGFDEYAPEAFAARAVALEYLKGMVDAAQKREHDAAELKRLQEAETARRIADEEKAAREAAAFAEKERIEQEEREAKERAEAEKKRQEEGAARIKREREEAAEAERKKAEREKAELELKLLEESNKAKREKEAAERRAEEEKKAAQERQDAAVKAERERIEKETQAAIDAAEKKRLAHEAEEARKAADKEHRGKIHRAIVDAMMGLQNGQLCITEAQARGIVIAICGDQIPELKILY